MLAYSVPGTRAQQQKNATLETRATKKKVHAGKGSALQPLFPPLLVHFKWKGGVCTLGVGGSLAPSPLLLGHLIQAYHVEVTTKWGRGQNAPNFRHSSINSWNMSFGFVKAEEHKSVG